MKALDNQLLTIDIFKTLFSGAMGALVVYYAPKWIKAIYYSRHPILVYQFADSDTSQEARRIRHSFGCTVADNDATVGVTWEHTAKRIDSGQTTCYGPYTKEIPFRGRYKARFRVKAIGIKNIEPVLLTLDVAHGVMSSDVIGPIKLGVVLVEKHLRGSDFRDEEYKDFDVEFDYDGESLIEFRCSVLNPEKYTDNVERILFDNVKVFPVIELV